jgi:hypothetical protein
VNLGVTVGRLRAHRGRGHVAGAPLPSTWRESSTDASRSKRARQTPMYAMTQERPPSPCSQAREVRGSDASSASPPHASGRSDDVKGEIGHGTENRVCHEVVHRRLRSERYSEPLVIRTSRVACSSSSLLDSSTVFQARGLGHEEFRSGMLVVRSAAASSGRRRGRPRVTSKPRSERYSRVRSPIAEGLAGWRMRSMIFVCRRRG